MDWRNPAVARVVPFVIYIVFLPFGGWVEGFVPGLDVRWLYAVQCALTVGGLWYWRASYTELREGPRVGIGAWAATIAVGLAVFGLWIHLDFGWLVLGSSDGFDPRDAQGRIDPLLAVLRVSGSALVVPLMEELFWRSFVARWVDRHDFLEQTPQALTVKALLVSSLLFASEHHLWFAGFLAGLAYGGLYRWTGNLWSPIVAHAITNGALGCWILVTGSWRFW